MQAYRIVGVEASPYAAKLRAILRYRRIPYVWDRRLPWTLPEFARLKPPLMPVVVYPDGGVHADSTPIALDLERRHPGVRSILPDDSGQALLACLIEDMADEWLTKILFHYRFSFAPDIRYAAFWVVDDGAPDVSTGADFEQAVAAFIDRQVARMPLVGATPANAPVLEAGFRRVLAALEPAIRDDGFLFGGRPSLADFAVFGQLRTLATDPTPQAIIRAEAPHAEHWIRRLDDTSGVDGAWRDPAASLSAPAKALLELAGDAYLPFLLANDAALTTGQDTVEVEIAGLPYRQPPFRYQAKCLAALRRRYGALPSRARAAVDPVLDETGCRAALAG